MPDNVTEPEFDAVAAEYVLGTLDDTVLILAAIPLLVGLLALLLLSTASIVVRYRGNADVVQRAQLKWLALGAAALPGTFVVQHPAANEDSRSRFSVSTLSPLEGATG